MSCQISVIVTCYNHLDFLPKMIDMLEAQTFRGFEIIIIDNNSRDGSREWIDQNKKQFSHVILNNYNEGLCKAFNQGVAISEGKYLIDLSPDDLFVEDKLERNFDLLEKEGAHLLFSDCIIKNSTEDEYLHSGYYAFDYIGKGNYYLDILERHCLISPTMVVSRFCYDTVDGYDESLVYEDFDFMTKSSAAFDLIYDSKALVIKQESKKNMSSQFKRRKSQMHQSTLEVCKKNKLLCKSVEEKKALKTRVWSEMKIQIRLLNLRLVWQYLFL